MQAIRSHQKTVEPRTRDLPPARASQYLVAVVSVALVTTIRLSLGDLLEEKGRFVLFLPAVMIASWYGGLGPGIFATALSAAIGVRFFIEPTHGAFVPTAGDWVGLVLFLVGAVMITAVNEAQRRSFVRSELLRQTVEDSNAELQTRQTEINHLNERLQRAVQETNHRVKNNLQVVAALIEITQTQHGETVPSDELTRIRDHIRGLADLHSILTQQYRARPDGSSVDSQDAFRDLIGRLRSATGLRVEECIESLKLPVKQAAALGLILNEAVTNSKKHGGNVAEVTLHRLDGRAVLTISDNGPGFKAGFDPIRNANAGLDLIVNLVRLDLHGTASFHNRPQGGAVMEIEFPAADEPTAA